MVKHEPQVTCSASLRLFVSMPVHSKQESESACLWHTLERRARHFGIQMTDNKEFTGGEMSRGELCSRNRRPFQTALTVAPLNSHLSYFACSTFKWHESASACRTLRLTCVISSSFFFSPITFKRATGWAVSLSDLVRVPGCSGFQSLPCCMVTFRARLSGII